MLEIARLKRANGTRVHVTFLYTGKLAPALRQGIFTELKNMALEKKELTEEDIRNVVAYNATAIQMEVHHQPYFITRYIFYVGAKDPSALFDDAKKSNNDVWQWMHEPLAFPEEIWPYLYELYDKAYESLMYASVQEPSNPEWRKNLVDAQRSITLILNITQEGDIARNNEIMKKEQEFKKEKAYYRSK